MNRVFVIAAVLGMVAGQASAQTSTPAPTTGFTADELEKMSQENLALGAHRGFAAGVRPAPAGSFSSQHLHQPFGSWLCRSTEPNVAILSAPNPSASPIARSDGQIAVGSDAGAYTSVLVHEGRIGYVLRASIRSYQNQFNPSASCVVAGLRPDGIVQFNVR